MSTSALIEVKTIYGKIYEYWKQDGYPETIANEYLEELENIESREDFLEHIIEGYEIGVGLSSDNFNSIEGPVDYSYVINMIEKTVEVYDGDRKKVYTFKLFKRKYRETINET